MTPDKYKKAVAAIEELTNEELAEMPLHDVLGYAMPHSVPTEVAESLGIPERTVQSWRVNPEIVTGSLKQADPSGRRGEPHQYCQFLLKLNGCFPPGARLLHRWEGIKLAKARSIQGHEQMQAVIQLADEARAIAEEARAAEEKARAFAAKVAALMGEAARE